MKMEVTLITQEGYYDHKTVEPCYNIGQGASKIVELLESMPEKIGNTHGVDWVRIVVEFKR